MKLKLLASALACTSLLFGCATTSNVPWQNQASVSVEKTNINLTSSLWINKMPTIGEEPTAPLHGSLSLSADREIPANMDVTAIVLRHGSDVVEVSDKDFEVEAGSENQWKVSFKQPEHFANEVDTLDVGVLLDNGQKQVWAVDKNVKVDLVF
ncbi:hypothetical protein [Vibrio gallicus]|uniref:hypothetical protein n=1 Tax=Vibrio gallicus TaxID=190897 RepID=UPI0021C458DE|nr:hypothetical protein [Vibrio gallicus]